MRLDKYLKVTRLIKRRTIANEACDAGKVLVNDKIARASYDVKVGDIISINMGQKPVKVEGAQCHRVCKKRRSSRELSCYQLKKGAVKKSSQEKKAAILPKSKTAVFFCGIIKVS